MNRKDPQARGNKTEKNATANTPDAVRVRADRRKGGRDHRSDSGKPIRNVINIGIGGSDLGPVITHEAHGI